MSRPLPEPHEPYAHRHHQPPSTCGCWTPGKRGKYLACNICGAAYLLADVCEFPRWRCYDCDGIFTDPALGLLKGRKA